MQLDVNRLFAMIGELYVQNQMLRAELAQKGGTVHEAPPADRPEGLEEPLRE